jgi:hypothetical protein
MKGAITMNGRYEELEIEVIEFETEDVITTSYGENTRAGEM